MKFALSDIFHADKRLFPKDYIIPIWGMASPHSQKTRPPSANSRMLSIISQKKIQLAGVQER